MGAVVGTSSGAGLVVAVDGPSGSGKSSTARGVATALGLRYLDTGAMYRALTWWLLDRGVDLADTDGIAKLAGDACIDVATDPAAPTVRVGEIDVSAQIRARAVSNAVSAVASVPRVREVLIAAQRAAVAVGRGGDGIVAEGRDIGTVVAPDAPVKVYLTADQRARALRRSTDQAARQASTEVTEAELARRDRLDAAQSAKAADAVLIDSTDLTLEQVVRRIVDLARQRVGAA